MKNSETSAARTEPDELEFPDWSGMDDSSGRLSIQAALGFAEHYPTWFPESFRRYLAQRPPKCPVEFTL